MARLTRSPVRIRPLLAVLAAVLLLAALPARAQTEARFFPETGQSITGAFRAFWEANGALANFGFPISAEYQQADGRTIQWFERARFELAVSNGQAQVELANLGREVTAGRVFPKAAPVSNTPDRRYIPETQHIIKFGFKEIWETRGAEQIFGFPISEEIQEVLENGRWHTVQYFEKARFEYWPELPPGERVLISHLGRQLFTALPPPPSQPELPPIPPALNGQVAPDRGGPGTTFVFTASGFTPGEAVALWLTAPDQSTFGGNRQVMADGQGALSGAGLSFSADASLAEGLYSFNAQGLSSGHAARAFFRLSRAPAPGDPALLGRLLHDQLPRQGQAFIVPLAAPPGASFMLAGAGFAADEVLSAWLTGPDGRSTPLDPAQLSRENGTAQLLIVSNGLPEGVYTAVIQGRSSQVLAAASFKLTRDYLAGPGTPRPANNNGSATPAEAGPGRVVQVRGQGLRPGESLDYWITDPAGNYVLLPDAPAADAQGRVGFNPTLDLAVPADALAGIYGVHFRGSQSGARVSVYFTVVR
jgi:hypothetical protein